MGKMRWMGALLVIVLGAAGCGMRELAWLVPRASVGFAVRTHEGHVASAGFVTLTTPLERPGRAYVPPTAGRPMHLLGRPSRCRVAEACRWEAYARQSTLGELAEDAAALELGATP